MKKMMFNDEYGLTQAVLEGRKIQTRRIVACPKKYKGIDVAGFYAYRRPSDRVVVELCMYDEDEIPIDEGQILPKYKIGEIVAVAQSYKSIGYQPTDKTSIIKANDVEFIEFQKHKGWNNKMFVQSTDMIVFIRITNVMVQRLQDISDEDCLKEGVVVDESKIKGGVRSYYPCKNLKEWAHEVGWGRVYNTPREAYAVLIDKVSGKGTWERNPWVWVYDFELVK